MKRSFEAVVLVLVLASLLLPRSASAVAIDWSYVGNPGNAADSADGDGLTPGLQHFGAVPYAYRIGTYDVTNSQYAEFLNSKDPTGANTLGLWNGDMADATYGGISFASANDNGSKYTLIAGRQNHPVNWVSWYDAIRFANWLNNGQGGGDTETGAYTLLGGTPTPSNGSSISRNAEATVFLPSEDEWYKAAYFNAVAGTYYQYPTSSDSEPSADFPPGTINSANIIVVHNLTDVGAYTLTTSPYGAFDMGGNVFQWNEALIGGSVRSIRGGSWGNMSPLSLLSEFRGSLEAATGDSIVGFRVARVPEPTSLGLAALGFVALVLTMKHRLRS